MTEQTGNHSEEPTNTPTESEISEWYMDGLSVIDLGLDLLENELSKAKKMGIEAYVDHSTNFLKKRLIKPLPKDKTGCGIYDQSVKYGAISHITRTTHGLSRQFMTFMSRSRSSENDYVRTANAPERVRSVFQEVYEDDALKTIPDEEKFGLIKDKPMIARLMHDKLTATLALVNMNWMMVIDHPERQIEWKEKIGSFINSAKKDVQELRQVVENEDDETVNLKDFISSIESFVNSKDLEHPDIDLRFSSDELSSSILGSHTRLTKSILDSVMNNTFENAIKGFGSMKDKRYRVRAKLDTNQIRFFILNNGEPIPDEIIENGYGQSIWKDESLPGNGMGMAMARDAVVEANGSLVPRNIRVRDEIWAGHVLTLPLNI